MGNKGGFLQIYKKYDKFVIKIRDELVKYWNSKSLYPSIVYF